MATVVDKTGKCSYCLKPLHSCGVCHNCFYGSKLKWPQPRTQKAKGVKAVSCLGFAVPPVLGLIQSLEQFDKLCPLSINSFIGSFARPCPKRPRHGFVDSRVIKSLEHLREVCVETFAADHDGEVMIMPTINAKWNAIWTPGMLAIGQGNDGATMGRDTISIPLAGIVPDGVRSILERAEVGSNEWPYIEAVGNPSATWLTQLRAGPVLVKEEVEFEVKEVIQTNGEDLLAWEAIMQASQGKPGLVVFHPGGSPLDHFTVHARTFKIPVVLGGVKPVVGEVIKIVPPMDYDPQEFLKGIAAAEGLNLAHNDLARLMLVCLYNSGVCLGEDAYWAGVGVGLMMRLGTAAVAGEARHASSPIPNRDAVYSKAFSMTLSQLHARLGRLIAILRYKFPTGPVGVGGEKWAICGAALIPLFDGVMELARVPSPEACGKLIRALNVAVDQAHNGGWWLNKFIEQEAFNQTQKGDLHNLLTCIPGFMSLADKRKVDLGKILSRYAKWTPLKIKIPTVLDARFVSYTTIGAVQIEIKFKERPFRTTPRVIKVNTASLIEKFAKGLDLQSLFIMEHPTGLKLESRRVGIDPIVLYEEGDLTHIEAGQTRKKAVKV